MKFDFGTMTTSIAMQRSRHNQPQEPMREDETQRSATFLRSCNSNNRKIKCSRQTGGVPLCFPTLNPPMTSAKRSLLVTPQNGYLTCPWVAP